ncbi:hypothetical protein ACOMHN_006306 [Nucella lapillus]
MCRSKDGNPLTYSAMPAIAEQTDGSHALRSEKQSSIGGCDSHATRTEKQSWVGDCDNNVYSKIEIPQAQTMADWPDLNLPFADECSQESFTVMSSGGDCDRATKSTRLSPMKAHSVDLHHKDSNPRLQLRKAESSPDMARAAEDASSKVVCVSCQRVQRESLTRSSLDLTDHASTPLSSPSLLTASVYTSKQGWLPKHKTAGCRQTVEPPGQGACCVDSCVTVCSSCVTAEGEGVCGCVRGVDSTDYVGMDIPMTNLGLTSAELMLLF